MISIFVTLTVKPEMVEQFKEASLGDAQGSVRDEPGCFRFDILQNQEKSNVFHLYEVYTNSAALDAHRQAPHYLKWRQAVQDMFAGESQRVEMFTVFPSEDGWKKQKPNLVNW